MAYLRCQYLPFTQIVLVPDLWDQLGFLVIKILGDNSHSLILLIKDENSLSTSLYRRQTREWKHFCCDDFIFLILSWLRISFYNFFSLKHCWLLIVSLRMVFCFFVFWWFSPKLTFSILFFNIELVKNYSYNM
jgi:hypothetical protein